jgi:ribosomal protein L11 methylase PrmA
VLDVGCGSGVLAIAAIKRCAIGGGHRHRPGCAANATSAALNETGDRVRFKNPDFRTMSARADVVVTNLTGALLEHPLSTFGALVTSAGRLIVSGFAEQADAVTSALNTVADLTRSRRRNGCARPQIHAGP